MLDAGELGDPLPPERVLAHWLNVNRLTLRWAIDRLIVAGRLVRHQGSGVRLGIGAIAIRISTGQVIVRSKHGKAVRAGRAETDSTADDTASHQAFARRVRAVSTESSRASVRTFSHDAPTFALIVDDPPHQVGGWAWRAAMQFVQSAQQRGGRIVMLTISQCLNPSSSQTVPAHFPVEHSTRTWRGAVVLSDRIDGAAFEQLLSLPCPIVGLGRCQARSVWNVIDVDWSPALHDAINDIPAGPQAGALILTSADSRALDGQRWCETLLCSLISHGFSAERVAIVPSRGGEGGAYLTVRRFLRRSAIQPNVVLADDDLSAAGARRALVNSRRNGSGVFVLGSGGTRVSQYLRPRLPTLSPPLTQITQLVNDWLTTSAAGRRFALQMLPARYVRRNTHTPSTAP
ncbi:MAG: GntR family transcriptional regulator [Phycisphaeraceae bacterium]|nr:GntR family transcriptional regulator [Phycisphaeraceae bacterium]